MTTNEHRKRVNEYQKRVDDAIRKFNEMLAALRPPADVPLAADLHEHLDHLMATHRIREERSHKFWALASQRLIGCPEITTERDYCSKLHEMGHIMTHGQRDVQ